MAVVGKAVKAKQIVLGSGITHNINDLARVLIESKSLTLVLADVMI